MNMKSRLALKKIAMGRVLLSVRNGKACPKRPFTAERTRRARRGERKQFDRRISLSPPDNLTCGFQSAAVLALPSHAAVLARRSPIPGVTLGLRRQTFLGPAQ